MFAWTLNNALISTGSGFNGPPDQKGEQNLIYLRTRALSQTDSSQSYTDRVPESMGGFRFEALLLGAIILQSILLRNVLCQDGEMFSVELYDLSLHINGEENPPSFDGMVKLDVIVLNEGDLIKLDCWHQLEVKKDVLVCNKEHECYAGEIREPVESVNQVGDILEIRMRANMQWNKTYSITINFHGELGGYDDSGLIYSRFSDNGQESWLAALRTAPTSARGVFPCLDRPDIPSRILLRVWRPTKFTCIANSRLNFTEEIAPGLSKDTFETSPVIALHQFSLVLAPLQNATDGSLSVWGPSDIMAELQSAISHLPRALKVMRNITGYSYPWDHLAVVAIPTVDDVAVVPGMIALGEASLAASTPAIPPAASCHAIMSLACGVSQPWTYSMSRPRHWKDAWSTQILAVHLQYKIGDKIQNEYNLTEMRHAFELQGVLEVDSKSTARPLIREELDTMNKNDIMKGAALLVMLEGAMNETVFNSSMYHFFNSVLGGTVGLEDLVDAMDREASAAGSLGPGVMLSQVLKSWTDQSGYPLITITHPDDDNDTIIVSQGRFYAMEADRPPNRTSEEWWVPFHIKYKDYGGDIVNTSPLLWLVPGENDMPVHLFRFDRKAFILADYQESGLFRVNYDLRHWQLIIAHLRDARFESWPAVVRARILGDATALAQAGLLEYATALDLSSYLFQERSLEPWVVARRGFQFLEDRLSGTTASSWLQEFLRLLVKEVCLDAIFQLGGPPDPRQRLLHQVVYPWACRLGYDQCLRHAGKAYRRWLAESNMRPSSEILGAVVCEAVRSGNETQWNHARNLWKASRLRSERLSFLQAMSCTRTTSLLIRMLEEAVESNSMWRIEVRDVFSSIASQGQQDWDLVATFMERNHPRILRRASTTDFERIVTYLASKITSSRQVEQMVKLVDIVKPIRESEPIREAIREAKNNIKWTERYYSEIADWLRVTLDIDESETTSTSKSPASPGTTSSTEKSTNSPTEKITNPPHATPIFPPITPPSPNKGSVLKPVSTSIAMCFLLIMIK